MRSVVAGLTVWGLSVLLYAASDGSGLVQACSADYQSFCQDVKPGGGRVVACLRKHLAELTNSCRDTLRDIGPITGDTPRQSLPAPVSAAPGSVLRDVSYGADPAQKLDVYIPDHPDHAAIMFMAHGGGWEFGDKGAQNVVEPKASYWRARQVIFISANYRMLPQAAPVDQAADLARAIAYVQAHAQAWGGDPARVVLMGHSAGAHLVSLITVDEGIARSAGVQPWLGTVALDSAAMDVPALMQSRHLPLYDRAFGKDPAGWAAVSPYQQLKARPVPMLLICSTERATSCDSAERMAAKIAQLGGKVTIKPLARSHMQINAEVGADNEETTTIDTFLHTLGVG
ncbi:alpha/beta hydrolase fold domain-containing protein [Silvimonas amylolytica]|uniref:BD-FAE-like domain-containing protein n=1 Tax=Silvimonas amylolytica TaxID=449663 RepID=A0ABQ2PJ54_9NEIS|nr:alpha/beta hydrolase fold domain-containing protein [Silvimonas amylolytica]GGP25633.1 hypothetical protein GCM10010971_14520 [Silvimonas amylolytica]